jgi:uncharacterized protein YndB with AHSA1/START domain
MTTVADGTVETLVDGRSTIRFERRLAHPIERVWEAITDPAQVIRWWGKLDSDMAEGGKFSLLWLNEGDEGENSGFRGTLTEFDPPRVLETRGVWGAEGEAWGETATLLRFELEPQGEGTILRFINTLELPDEFAVKTPAGWHWHLDALAGVLDGAPDRNLASVEGWEPIHEAYVEKLEPAQP